MRRDGIPYVQNPKNYYPPIDINKMSLEELKSKFLKICGKSQGNLSVCSKCPTPCQEGKRALQLLANEVYDNPHVPLFGGKTLIENAKEENARRRAAEEAKKLQEKMELHKEEKEKEQAEKRTYIRDEEWWDASLQFGNQIQYLMDTYGLTHKQAQKKVYNHKKKYKEKKHVAAPVVKEAKPAEETPAPIAEKSDDIVIKTFEMKIDDLMKKQDEYKKKADEYTKLYEEITSQIDVLCKAMDVFDKV